ncbi:MAG TPA: PepSY-associated TM helix domain-containing protein [Sediminibacterium sp.]|nr:PepSY-associated TM helix domain-containing protein [Sediminibacterium sp.]
MRFKKIIGKIHLWLGLGSGLLVVFLGITGCILAFETEIRKLTEPEQFVPVENKAYLPPSVLKTAAEQYLDGKKLNTLEYPGRGRSALAAYYDTAHYKIVVLDPYSGKMLKLKNMNHDFFRIIINGHYYLWLPPAIGRPIVATATLVFLVMLVSGIILWWPRNKAAKKQRFTFRWRAGWKRKNYDLHSVAGFYASWIAVFIAISGLVMGFQWFAGSVYWISSGGKTMQQDIHPVSDTSFAKNIPLPVCDRIWQQLSREAKANESITIYFPLTGTDPIEGVINHRPGTYYQSDYFHYDQYSGKELPATGIYAGKYRDATVANRMSRMNYDIHVGAILGLPGKILAFCGSLIAASLPVTGFLLWRGRRKK